MPTSDTGRKTQNREGSINSNTFYSMENPYSLRKLAIDGTVNGGHNMHTNRRRKWALSICSVLIRAHWRLMKHAPNVAIFLCPERIKDRDKVTHRYIRPIRFFLLKKKPLFSLRKLSYDDSYDGSLRKGSKRSMTLSVNSTWTLRQRSLQCMYPNTRDAVVPSPLVDQGGIAIISHAYVSWRQS